MLELLISNPVIGDEFGEAHCGYELRQDSYEFHHIGNRKRCGMGSLSGVAYGCGLNPHIVSKEI